MSTTLENAKPLQLLLVDDDRVILATLSGGFRHAGYQVHTADAVDDAVSLLQGGLRPDMSILDVHMPQADGLSLAERLRDFYHLPFMMFSAYSDEATVRQSTTAGALGYLVKPMEVAQMLPTVEAAIARHHELQLLRQNSQQLQAALQAERDVNVAVGIAMMQHRISREDAFNLVRNAARRRRVKLADLAAEIIQAGEVLNL